MGGATLERSDLIGPWIISVGFKQEFVPAIVIAINGETYSVTNIFLVACAVAPSVSPTV